MIEAGVDAFRIKCSHHSVEVLSQSLMQARQQIDQNGGKVKLLADLPEAKIRLGEFPQARVVLPAGREYNFREAKASADPENFIPIDYPGVVKHLSVGDQFYVGDGLLAFTVTEITDEQGFKARTDNSSKLILRTSLTLPKVIGKLNHVTPIIDEILKELPKSRPEMVAFSFVGSKRMLQELKKKLANHTSANWQPQVIAKIESEDGVKNIDEILEEADGIMVARGDLALCLPYYQLGKHQKYLVKKAKEKGKYVIVATQVLQSLLENYLPMRSDILDLTNIYLDGASAVMLCMETAHSETPERAVKVAKEIINFLKSEE